MHVLWCKSALKCSDVAAARTKLKNTVAWACLCMHGFRLQVCHVITSKQLRNANFMQHSTCWFYTWKCVQINSQLCCIFMPRLQCTCKYAIVTGFAVTFWRETPWQAIHNTVAKHCQFCCHFNWWNTDILRITNTFPRVLDAGSNTVGAFVRRGSFHRLLQWENSRLKDLTQGYFDNNWATNLVICASSTWATDDFGQHFGVGGLCWY